MKFGFARKSKIRANPLKSISSVFGLFKRSEAKLCKEQGDFKMTHYYIADNILF